MMMTGNPTDDESHGWKKLRHTERDWPLIVPHPWDSSSVGFFLRLPEMAASQSICPSLSNGPLSNMRRAMKKFLHTAAILLTATLVSVTTAAPPSPVTALAYRADGSQLAAGVRGE